MDKYILEIVLESKYYVHFHLYVNDELTTNQQVISMGRNEFDRFFKVLFKGSKGNCVKMYSNNPPTQFYP